MPKESQKGNKKERVKISKIKRRMLKRKILTLIQTQTQTPIQIHQALPVPPVLLAHPNLLNQKKNVHKKILKRAKKKSTNSI